MKKYTYAEPTLEQIINLYDVIGKFSNENYQLLSKFVAVPDDYPDFYFGILRRIRGFAFDIKAILTYSRNIFPTTIFIIARCVCDDLLSIYHVKYSDDHKEEIIRNTADAFKQSITKIEYLEYLNRTYYDNKYPYYPTEEKVNEVKSKFFNSGKGYFLNPENTDITKIKFKPYPNYKVLVETIMKKSDRPEDIGHVYYWWRELSSNVHFSTYSMNTENEILKFGTLYNVYQEFASFMLLSLREVLIFFNQRNEYTPVDNYQLFK